jgi:uncharacterized protein YoxC
MAAEVTREEFTTLEREVEGEKMVTRHILEQTRRNGDDLAAVKSRLDRVESRLDGVEQRLGGVERKLDGVEQRLDGLSGKTGGLERKVDGLTKSLPQIVGEVMREVLDERDHRR